LGRRGRSKGNVTQYQVQVVRCNNPLRLAEPREYIAAAAMGC
jgi:hypothetical protein